jgi:hypothetical protein
VDDRTRQAVADLRRGLDEGGLGLVAARAGVGKSSCLVQIALSELVAGAPALHVTLVDAVAHVRRRYDQVLASFGRDDALHLAIERLRHIHGYFDGNFDAERLDGALRFLAEHVDFCPRLVVLDGGGKELTKDYVEDMRALCDRRGLEVWLTTVTPRAPAGGDGDADGLPESLSSLEGLLDVVVRLVPDADRIDLRTWRPPPAGWSRAPLVLDPRTTLLVPDGPDAA